MSAFGSQTDNNEDHLGARLACVLRNSLSPLQVKSFFFSFLLGIFLTIPTRSVNCPVAIVRPRHQNMAYPGLQADGIDLRPLSELFNSLHIVEIIARSTLGSFHVFPSVGLKAADSRGTFIAAII